MHVATDLAAFLAAPPPVREYVAPAPVVTYAAPSSDRVRAARTWGHLLGEHRKS